jgi:hypothetical protein
VHNINLSNNDVVYAPPPPQTLHLLKTRRNLFRRFKALHLLLLVSLRQGPKKEGSDWNTEQASSSNCQVLAIGRGYIYIYIYIYAQCTVHNILTCSSQQGAGIIMESRTYTASCLAYLGKNGPAGCDLYTVMDGPYRFSCRTVSPALT